MKKIAFAFGLTLFCIVLLVVAWSILNTESKTVHVPLETQYVSPTQAPSEGVTLETQVGQLFMIGHWAHTPVASTTVLIEKYQVGGVILMSTPEDPNEILSWIASWNSVSNTPLLIAIDQEGGPVNRLKTAAFIQTGQKAITSVEQAYSVGAERGQELARLGINLNFSPVLDTTKNADSFLYARTFPAGTDAPALAGAMLGGLATANVAGAIKHFPGHDDTNVDSHFALPVVDLQKTQLAAFTKPFAEVIEKYDPPFVMTAHVQFPDIDPLPATLSPFFLTEYLRNTLGYQGIIVTDDMSMDAIDAYYDTAQATTLTVAAGADIVLLAAEPEKVHQAFAGLLESIQESPDLREQITVSYNRHLDYKNTFLK